MKKLTAVLLCLTALACGPAEEEAPPARPALKEVPKVVSPPAVEQPAPPEELPPVEEAPAPTCTGEGEACYTGPEGTAGVGACRAGLWVCSEANPNGVCLAQSLPSAEVCDGADNDCDGEVDEAWDFLSDALNCGGCGVTCQGEETCQQGTCTLPWVDLENDSTNCGTRGNRCLYNQVCSAGECVVDCTKVSEAQARDTYPECRPAVCARFEACFTWLECEGVELPVSGAICIVHPDFGSNVTVKGELSCSDGLDNDSNAYADCADSTCHGRACTRADGTPGTCYSPSTGSILNGCQ